MNRWKKLMKKRLNVIREKHFPNFIRNDLFFSNTKSSVGNFILSWNGKGIINSSLGVVYN